MRWADFHRRCAPDQPLPSAADPSQARHAGLGLHGAGGLPGAGGFQAAGGLASLVPSQVTAGHPTTGHPTTGQPTQRQQSLPDGAPRITKAVLQDLVRRREASRASEHLATPVVPPPPREAPPPEARAA